VNSIGIAMAEGDGTGRTPAPLGAGGFCRRCGREHWLGPGNTLETCRQLMNRLNRQGAINLFSNRQKEDETLETAPLFGPSRGKMFGVMECLTQDGGRIFCYAFSGQYNGIWLVDGWAPPLFEGADFFAVTHLEEKRIKQLGREIDCCTPHSAEWLAGRKRRRQLSRELMHTIHSLYRLHNFRGEVAGLQDAFAGDSGIPTGTGDCCAPKLLNYAARNNMRPLGLSEFFWGRENKAGGHRHGVLTASCVEKCRPILGFMLCGLDDR